MASDEASTTAADATGRATAAAATTHYDSLNVPPTATHAEIKSAFRRLARLHHPDKRRNVPPTTAGKNGGDDDGNDDNYDGRGIEPDGGDVDDDDVDVDYDGGAERSDVGGDDEFRTVQAAWLVLGDSDRRTAYDRDLLQRHLRDRARVSGALTVHVGDNDGDVAEAVDEETGERFYVYGCRCGEEIFIDDIVDDDNNNNNNNAGSLVAADAATAATGAVAAQAASGAGGKVLFVDCPGCCFVYRVVGLP